MNRNGSEPNYGRRLCSPIPTLKLVHLRWSAGLNPQPASGAPASPDLRDGRIGEGENITEC
uniref:Uncharacterized protein n=1 Tax=Anguilla anguilla TaxID=7936 RepID=A0A0E9VKT0_ANGAN